MTTDDRVPPLYAEPTRPPVGDLDPPLPDPDLLRRYGAVVLDPASAVRLPEQAVRGTVYVRDRLLVPFSRVTAVQNAVTDVLVTFDDRLAGLAQRLAPLVDLPIPVTLTATAAPPQAAPDAWTVLQQLRAADAVVLEGPAGQGAPAAPAAGAEGAEGAEEVAGGATLLAGPSAGIGLVHLMTAFPPSVGPHPIGATSAFGTRVSGYVLNGNVRMPVCLTMPPPARSDIDCEHARRPVVAVLDTGCGLHAWLPPADRSIVDRAAEWAVPIGYTDPDTDPERHPDQYGGLDGVLDWVAGHGTFIAGLIRQQCPDATVLAVRIISGDGGVLEDNLVLALAQLLDRLKTYREGTDAGGPVDVVVLSLGYYHETPADALADSPLRVLLEAFGRLGTCVVVAAGNESTSRPSYPAFFAPHEGAEPDPDVVPVLNVGALNPDGTVALFSNSGPPDGSWVTAWRPGALVVSTLPAFQGGLAPDDLLEDPSGRIRSDLDPDAYGTGFGLWSGTSFSAPILAGEIAAALFDAAGSAGAALLAGDADPVPRSWAAVTETTGLAP